MAGAALEGSFGELGLADLVTLLLASGRSGVVSCEGAHAVTLVVAPPLVVWAEVPGAPSLDDTVVAAGLATADQAERARADARRSGSLARALLAAGVAEPALAELMADHTSSALLPLFADAAVAAHTRFTFLAGASHPVGTDVGIARVALLEMVEQRAITAGDLPAELGSPGGVFRARPDDVGSEVVLDAEEWRVLAHLDGRAPVAEVARRTGWSWHRVAAVLGTLLRRGLVVAA